MTASSPFGRAPPGPPFRAEHIGSLLRPPSLKSAVATIRGRMRDEQAFAAAVDASIRDVVGFQERIGLEGITDGEFRRVS